MTIRNVDRILRSLRQKEGGGFIVRRPFPTAEISYVDPFLLLDEMGPADYGPGEAVGAPDHPHRGFETVTYMLDGEFEHEDSAGHKGKLSAGDVQWMTAGHGVIHSEVPSARIVKEGGRVHGFQIWVNLPKRDKLMAPRYQEIAAAKIPVAASPDGKARGKIIAGSAFGRSAVIETRIPIVYQDWTIEPGGEVSLALDREIHPFVYVFEGEAEVGAELRQLAEGEVAIFGEGDTVKLSVSKDAKKAARMLLLGGKPLNEPVARYGPFVMNDDLEIRQAMLDYQFGKLGKIARA